MVIFLKDYSTSIPERNFTTTVFCFFDIHCCGIVMGGEREAQVKRLSSLPWFLSHLQETNSSERQTGEMRYQVNL